VAPSATVRPAWKLLLQLLFLLVGAAAFLWLVNVLTRYDGDPYLPELMERLSRDAWIAVSLVTLGAVFLIEVLLLRPSHAKPTLPPEEVAWTPATVWVAPGAERCSTAASTS
jgi:hypothetical protein